MSKTETSLYPATPTTIISGMGKKVVNISSVPHRSVFRYPGGKTWLVPYVRRWLAGRPQRPKVFSEPFAGGGIVGLSVLFESLVDSVLLVEIDEHVAAVWKTLLNGKGRELALRILNFDLTRENAINELTKEPKGLLDLAFHTILRNRVQRGGIMAPGAGLIKNGENGNGISSRWYPQTLHDRILSIVEKKSHISFVEGDGLKVLRKYSGRSDYVWFIDPPYTVAGKRLYLHSEINHSALFEAVSKLKGDFLLTYDDAEPIRNLALSYGFDTHRIPMKNTHHNVMFELLIGKNLSWSRQPLKFTQDSLFKTLNADGHASG